MKPKEFDELVRQKFDRNDFAYDPENWDRLAEKLEGRDKKRSIIMWWWVPLAGMAASVALAMGISTLLRQQMPGNTAGNIAQATAGKSAPAHAAQHGVVTYLPGTVQQEGSGVNMPMTASANNTRNSISHLYKHNNKHTANKATEQDEEDSYGINLTNAVGNKVVWQAKKIDLTKETTAPDNKNKKVAIVEAIETFKPEEEQVVKPSKLSIILSGGVNRGNQNSGYMGGATIRRMINDKVYVESDVAFASSTNTQSTAYVQEQIPVAPTVTASRHMSSAKTTEAAVNKAARPFSMEDIIGEKNISYDLYYAQVTPSIGYKVIKKMSIALGPDFQKMLGDNRPAPSTVDRNNIQVAPTFDVGFIGKTEYALTKKVRAGVYYRKGINNIITPMDKFIDRDYVQFQVKYTIFNK